MKIMEIDKRQEPLVSICSITYNHAPYIRQCLDGFLMQRTTFPIEIIINDDCSTDGTTEIVREYADKYPDLIFPIFHEENQYQKGVRGMFQRFVFPKARGKYIALCEGDDYWTDPLKLQKQVDILEKYPKVTMVYSAFQPIDENNQEIHSQCYEALMSYSSSGDIFYKLIRTNFPMTLTTCFRKEVFGLGVYRNCPQQLDWSLFLAAATIGRAYYIPEKLANYRKHSMGMSSTLLPKMNFSYHIRFYYFKCFLDGEVEKKGFIQSLKILTMMSYTLFYDSSVALSTAEIKLKQELCTNYKVVQIFRPVACVYNHLRIIKLKMIKFMNNVK